MNLKDDVFLRANYSANAEVILSEAKNVLTLESAHIRYDDNGDAYVEVLKPGTENYDQPVFPSEVPFKTNSVKAVSTLLLQNVMSN